MSTYCQLAWHVRRTAHLVLRVDVGAALQQEAHHRDGSVRRSAVQRRLRPRLVRDGGGARLRRARARVVTATLTAQQPNARLVPALKLGARVQQGGDHGRVRVAGGIQQLRIRGHAGGKARWGSSSHRRWTDAVRGPGLGRWEVCRQQKRERKPDDASRACGAPPSTNPSPPCDPPSSHPPSRSSVTCARECTARACDRPPRGRSCRRLQPAGRARGTRCWGAFCWSALRPLLPLHLPRAVAHTRGGVWRCGPGVASHALGQGAKVARVCARGHGRARHFHANTRGLWVEVRALLGARVTECAARVAAT